MIKEELAREEGQENSETFCVYVNAKTNGSDFRLLLIITDDVRSIFFFSVIL